jgi:hypothetical protein
MNNSKKELQIYCKQFYTSGVKANKAVEVRAIVQDNTPLLFNKKIKKGVVKPLKHIYSDTGITRHFTPAAQE